MKDFVIFPPHCHLVCMCVALQDCTCKEDPCKCPPKEDESLKNQNSLTAKLENDKAATEDNAEEVNSLQNNMNNE